MKTKCKLKTAIGIILGLAAFSAAAHTFVGAPISTRFNGDPSPHYFKGRYYLYATNDQDNSGKYWDSTDWRVFSSRAGTLAGRWVFPIG